MPRQPIGPPSTFDLDVSNTSGAQMSRSAYGAVQPIVAQQERLKTAEKDTAANITQTDMALAFTELLKKGIEGAEIYLQDVEQINPQVAQLGATRLQGMAPTLMGADSATSQKALLGWYQMVDSNLQKAEAPDEFEEKLRQAGELAHTRGQQTQKGKFDAFKKEGISYRKPAAPPKTTEGDKRRDERKADEKKKNAAARRKALHKKTQNEKAKKRLEDRIAANKVELKKWQDDADFEKIEAFTKKIEKDEDKLDQLIGKGEVYVPGETGAKAVVTPKTKSKYKVLSVEPAK